MKTELSCRETCPFIKRDVFRGGGGEGEPVMAESAPGKRQCGTRFVAWEAMCCNAAVDALEANNMGDTVQIGNDGDKIVFVDTLPANGKIVATIEDGILTVNQ